MSKSIVGKMLAKLESSNTTIRQAIRERLELACYSEVKKEYRSGTNLNDLVYLAKKDEQYIAVISYQVEGEDEYQLFTASYNESDETWSNIESHSSAESLNDTLDDNSSLVKGSKVIFQM